MTAVAPTTAEQVLAAAAAALSLLPIAAGAAVEPADVADLPPQWSGVLRRFTGTRGGSAGLLLDPEAAASLTTAMAQVASAPAVDVDPAGAATGDAALVAACVPALDAMSEALGPIAVMDAVATTGQTLAGQLGGAAVAVISVDGTPQAYVVLLLDPADLGPVPAPRSGAGAVSGAPDSAARGMDLLRSVPMEVTAEIGRTRMTISELLALSPGAVVELDRPVGSPADVLVNGRLFARGEVVVVDEDFAIRITEIVDVAAESGAP